MNDRQKIINNNYINIKKSVMEVIKLGHRKERLSRLLRRHETGELSNYQFSRRSLNAMFNYKVSENLEINAILDSNNLKDVKRLVRLC